MSNKLKRIDTNQQVFDFDTPIAEYEKLRGKLLAPPEKPKRCECFEEACIEIAATVKSAIRTWGKSRECLVDAINDYYGATDPAVHKKHLSIHMLNHYLSKPQAYPFPAPLLFAIQHITGSLETISALAKSEGAQVIDKTEVQQLALGKIDAALYEIQRLKKEFRGINKK